MFVFKLKQFFVLCCFVGTAICSSGDIKVFPDQGACDPETRPRVIQGFPATVNSPFYPDNYPPNALCEWVFTNDNDYVPAARFSAFAVENCIDCACDYVEFYDGDSDEAPFLSRSCGNEPEDEAASSNSLFMRFVSDNTSEFSGFETTVTLSEPACGETIRDSNGTISSPNYPDDYTNDLVCEWLFEAPEDMRIQFDILDFQTEDRNCIYDYLEAFNGPDDSASRIGYWFDDDQPPRLMSSGNTMYVKFTTDSSVTFRGFIANYLHVKA